MSVHTPTHSGHRHATERANHRHATNDHRNLVKGLEHDLACEYQAMLMYLQYSAKLTGPHRLELRELFKSEITDECGHAQLLADKIAALGGDPAVEPPPVPDAMSPPEMLHHVLELEQQAIANYVTRARQAEQCGDVGLKVELENLVAAETRHKEEVERILTGWS